MIFSLKTKRKMINNNQPFAAMAKCWKAIGYYHCLEVLCLLSAAESTQESHNQYLGRC